MAMVPLVSLCAYRERLAATEFETLIEPHLGNPVTQDRIVVVCHLQLSVRSVEGVQETQEVDSFRTMQDRSVAEPGKGRVDV